MPNNTIKLKQLLEQYVRDKVAKSEGKYISGRLSPLGIPEFIVDPNKSRMVPEGISATTSPRPIPQIFYSPKTANYPDTQTHERIHAGQYLLPDQIDAPIEQINQIFGTNTFGSDDPVPSAEIPAYEFSYDLTNPKNNPKYINRLNLEKQNKFNQYLDLMNRLNADQAESLEAAMPPQMLTNFIRDYARRLSSPRIIKNLD